MSISVENGLCPVNGKMAYALYHEGLPVVPATIFLRHLQANLDYSANTLAAYANALKIFFSFLAESGLSFWNLTPAHIKNYKRLYLYRLDESGQPLLKRKTARQYLSAVRCLIGYWRSFRENDPLFIDQVSELDGRRQRRYSRGALAHVSWYSRVPSSLWRVGLPRSEKNYKSRYKGLSREEMYVVARSLELAVHQTDVETMLYYRNRAIWKFMLMTLLRKGELVRIRLEDLDQRNGIIHLVERPEDAWLGELKTGPEDIFVGTNNPFWSATTAWLTEGRWIAEKLLEQKGKSDHGMLFCNRDGGHLTQASVDHLFAVLNKSCKFNRKIKLFPHIARHTMASLLLDSGVGLTEVQKILRHQSVASTEMYAKVSDTKYRQALIAFWQDVKEE
jgi:site-specific recombinase XerD